MEIVKIKVRRVTAPEGQDQVINCHKCGCIIVRGKYCIVSVNGDFIVGDKFPKPCPNCGGRQNIPMLYNDDYASNSAVIRYNIMGVPKELLFFVTKQRGSGGSV